MMQKYTVIFEHSNTNWAAYVPDLPGCISTGGTLKEVEHNVREAISGASGRYRRLVNPSQALLRRGRD